MVVDYVRVYDIEEVGDQSPFGSERIAIPGVLQVENYDEGCFGASYVDADAENQGGDFRLDEGVDIQSTTDIGGGYNVGWTDVGEWTEYSVTVATTGEYAVTARLASGDGDGGAFHLEIGGQNISGNIGTGNTGDWQSWVDVSVDGVELSAGDHIIRLVVDNNAVNINYLDFDFLTSTDEVIQGIDVTVFPNPAKQFLRVESSITLAEWEVISHTGTPLLSGDLNQSSEIDVSSLEPGSYMIKVTGVLGSAFERITIQ